MARYHSLSILSHSDVIVSNDFEKDGKRCQDCVQTLARIPWQKTGRVKFSLTCDNWKCRRYRQPQGSISERKTECDKWLTKRG